MKNLLAWNFVKAGIITVFLMAAAQYSVFGQCCMAFSTNGLLNAFVTSYPNWTVPSGNPSNFGYTTPASLLAVDVTDTNAEIPAGVYPAWCIDEADYIPTVQVTVPGTPYSGTLISTCDPLGLSYVPQRATMPPLGPPPIVTLDTWHQINYILNHKTGYYFWNVEVALNRLVGGPAPDDPLFPPVDPSYPPVDTNQVDAMLSDAAANAANWVVPCGGTEGIIYAVPDTTSGTNVTQYQILLLEVPCCEVSFTKCPGDKYLGCNPPLSSIPVCQSPVDTNVVSAYSCCGYPVTITCAESDSTSGCTSLRYLIYTASDQYGNTATCMQTISWTTDTNAPVITSVPTNSDLGCNPISLPTDASIQAQVKVIDNCSVQGATVTHVDSGTPCGMTRTFTITASDVCGNVSVPKIVTYTWRVDTNAPTITGVPSGGNLGCNPASLPTDANIAASITVMDNCTVQGTNVSHLDTTNACTITRTFTITAVDECGNVSPAQTVAYTWTADTTPPTIICPPDITITNTVLPYCTYSPSDYGSACNGTNASSILTNCFKKVYPGGYLQCGITNYSGYCLKFTTCTNIQKYAPCGGSPGCLRNSYNNPSSCEAGSFGGQVLCLKLNVDFGDCKSVTGFGAGCGDLILNDPTCPLNGQSVRQILSLCQTGLGGGNISGCGCTISNLSVICSNLNLAFENCNPSAWCQGHLVPPAFTNVSPSLTGYATVVDKCSTPSLTYTDSITAGGCTGNYVIARTWIAVDGCGNSNYCTQNIYVGSSQASVCGTVFMDCNGDGFLTPGVDVGMSNVVVTLKNSQGVAIATNATDGSGSYCFYNLTPGTYTASITQPGGYNQTAGTHTNHWLNTYGQQCWNENDGYQHCKGGDGVDRWTANDGCQHWKNSNNQDCWTDKYGVSHSQNCTYVSCDAPKGNSETFTLGPCASLSCVNFAYQGTVPKACVCVTGPNTGYCWGSGTYTCCITNTGTACFTSCQVTACGKTYSCPPLSPGQGCSIPVCYQYQWTDCGTYNCQAQVSCGYAGSSNPCTTYGSCNTSVYW